MLPQREDKKLRKMFLRYHKERIATDDYNKKEELYENFIEEVSRTFTWTLKESYENTDFLFGSIRGGE